MKFIFLKSLVVFASLFCSLAFGETGLKSCDGSEAESGLRSAIIKDVEQNIPEADVSTIKVSLEGSRIAQKDICEGRTPYSSETYKNIRTGTYYVRAQVQLQNGGFLVLGFDGAVMDQNAKWTGKYKFSEIKMKTHLVIDSTDERVTGIRCGVEFWPKTISNSMSGAIWYLRNNNFDFKKFKTANINVVNIIPFHNSADIKYDPNQPPQSGMLDGMNGYWPYCSQD